MEPSAAPAVAYPVQVELNRDYRVANWRPLVNWLLAIPQLIVLYVIGIVFNILVIIAFFAVLFTTKIPTGIFGMMAMYHRYTWRVESFALFMKNEYPPFTFDTTASDPGGDPAYFAIEEPPQLNRWLPLVKWLLAIPHYIVLFVLFLAVFVVKIIAFFAVLFTGKYPEGLRDFVVGVIRWQLRVQCYVYLMTDAYPPFSLR
jgi:roadblock/LC7 domain-containing protein